VAAAATDILRWLAGLPASLFHAYSSALGWATDSVRDLFDSYGYWVVFFGTFFENTLFLGALIPGVLVILLAGISSYDGGMSPFLAFVIAAVGTSLGDTISYAMGRYGWSRVARGGAVHQFAERVRDPIMRRGFWFVLLYHFAGYTRLLGPAGAGLLRMPYRRWAVADHLGACIWVGTHIAIGYGLGAAGISLDSTDQYFKIFEWVLLAAVALWFVYLYRSGWKSLRRAFWEGPPPGEAPPSQPDLARTATRNRGEE